MPEYGVRFFRSGALRIHFRDWGNPTAPPLVIVHGLRDHSHSFDDLSRAMADASICGLGQAAPNPIACVIKYFPDELK